MLYTGKRNELVNVSSIDKLEDVAESKQQIAEWCISTVFISTYKKDNCY